MREKMSSLRMFEMLEPRMLLAADYWVAPMQDLNASFTGLPGTIARFGDSITFSKSFFHQLRYQHQNVPDATAEAFTWIQDYLVDEAWDWQGAAYGSKSGSVTGWPLTKPDGSRRVDIWLETLNPEIAVVMWGSNDVNRGRDLSESIDSLREVVTTIKANNTIPVLTTIPPIHEKEVEAAFFADQIRALALEEQVPLIDFHDEILTRAPGDTWNGALVFEGGNHYEVERLVSGDGLHPSNPQPRRDFSEESLSKNGYTLRNYITLNALHEVYLESIKGTEAIDLIGIDADEELITSEAGESSAFEISLNDQPTHGVTIEIEIDKPAEATTESVSVTFTRDNWQAPKKVVVRGLDDSLDDGPAQYSVSFNVLSEDSRFERLELDPLAFVNLDNDLDAERIWNQVPALPEPSGRILSVASEQELQQAMLDLSPHTTVLLEPGVYRLSKTLYVREDDVTIRGATGNRDDVVLIGKGMDNSDFGDVPHGIWSDAARTHVQNLTIQDVYYHPITLSSIADSPEVYNVRLVDAGEQFLKSNSGGFGIGVDGGKVEYTVFEYSNGIPKTDHGPGIGYLKGIDVHGGEAWAIRNNLFKDLHAPDDAEHRWNPAILMWNGARETLVEGNTFVNVDRAVAFGLSDTESDHSGGLIRNNMVYVEPGLYSENRRQGSDGLILVWNSENTGVYHNTILSNGNHRRSIEFRWATSGGRAYANLVDKPLNARQGGAHHAQDNQLDAVSSMFVDAETADLHITSPSVVTQVPSLAGVPVDIDGESRNALTHVGADSVDQIFGDFDGDRIVDEQDIDLLAVRIREGDYAAEYDLNSDGELDVNDREFLLVNVLGTSIGDSNLDGCFDTSDLVLVFQWGQFEDDSEGNSFWASGDWNGDAEFTTSDIIYAFQNGTWKG